ncbi:MAG: RNA 2',3'-cyclic phosphodiesterase [Candidatus Nealsonbacteria bacterium]
MRHRVFIAINLPEKVKNNLLNFSRKWPELPVKWVRPENLHLTLEFLGYVSDGQVLEILDGAREVASRQKPFSLKLVKVCYGPPKKIPPRMIWVEGEKSEELGFLKKNLENCLMGFSLQKELRVFSPHITLGRVRTFEWRRIEPEERPGVKEDISLSFEVNSIEVMESQLKRRGPEYSVLESCPFPF